jgi:hypothetical protein
VILEDYTYHFSHFWSQMVSIFSYFIKYSMKNNPIIILLIFFSIGSVRIYSQNIEGVVVDKKTKFPLSGANLRIGGKGFVSNKLGEFRIKRVIGKITISYIGYETITLNIEPQKNFYVVEMPESVHKLPEVVVNSNARSIVDKAFAKINQNYPQKLHTYKGFITEYNRFDRKSYIYQLESFIKIEHEAYDKSQSLRVEVLQKKAKTFYNLDTLLFVKWQGTPRIVDYANFVNEKADFINPSKNDKYVYKLIDIIPFDGRDVYVISFEQAKKKKKESGRLYIDYESLGFVGLDYQFEDKNEDTSRREVKVRYEQINEKWYLQNITYDEISDYKITFVEKKVPTEIHLEFQRTELDTLLSSEKKLIDYTKNFQRRDILLESNVPMDSLFWRENSTKGGSPDKDFEEFLSTRKPTDLTENQTNKGSEIKFKHKLFKYLFQGFHLEASLGTFPIGMINNQINFLYRNNINGYVISENREVNRINNVGYFLGWSFDLPKNWGVALQSGRNLPGSGLSQRLLGINFSKKLTTRVYGHPFTVAPTLGIDFLRTSKSFNDVALPSEVTKSYGLDDDDVCPTLNKEHLFLSKGLKFSYEINRKKSLFLSVKYNSILSSNDYLELEETSGFFLFRGSHKIYDLPENSKMKTVIYPISFQFGLTF